MKDKELREIVYRSCKEFDEKLEFIFNELCKTNPELKKTDNKNPFTRLGETWGYADGTTPEYLRTWRILPNTKMEY